MVPDPRTLFHAALDAPFAGSSDFDLNPEVVLPEQRVLRPAAVLVAYQMRAKKPYLLLTKRSLTLKHHPGQIAFPGGQRDKMDTELTHTALREAHEEIGLPPNKVDLLGQLPPHETVTGFNVTPVLGRIKADFVAVPEPGEVAEVFCVPLAHVTEPTNFVVQSRRWRGQRRYYYTVPYGPYYIWGATARILRRLIA